MSHRFTFPIPTDHAPGFWHEAYCPVFSRLFLPFVGYETNLLEIGTDGGGMLKSYREYFPNGYIYGIDISPTPQWIEEEMSNEYDLRLRHFQRDAYDSNAIRMLSDYGPFHIIIDDGPHTLSSQQFFVEHYPQLLTPDGILICEDVAEHGHIAELQRCLPAGWFGMGIDLTNNAQKRYDDRLFVAFRL